MTIHLNGLSIRLSTNEVEVWRKGVSPDQVKQQRVMLGDAFFSYFHEGTLYVIPKEGPKVLAGFDRQVVQFGTHLGMKIAAAFVGDSLPGLFPMYVPMSIRPFVFVAQKNEFIGEAAKSLSVSKPLLSSFAIRLKYEIEPKLIELRDGELQLMLSVSPSTNWSCQAELEDLQKAGIELSGYHVLRRVAQLGEKRLIGRIGRIVGGTVFLSESYDDVKEYSINDLKIEGSREFFSHALGKLIGRQYTDFSRRLDSLQAKHLNGPGLAEFLRSFEAFLRSKNPIRLTGDISFEVGKVVRVENRSEFKTIVSLNNAKYCFNRSRTKLSDYAWLGLENHGPYDLDSFAKRSPRILVICPDKAAGRISQSIKQFRDGILSLTDSRFSSGFSGTFRLVNPEFISLTVPLFGVPSQEVARAYRSTIEDHLARDGQYDVAINLLMDEHAYLPDQCNPYLGSKALLLANGIPVQEAKVSTLLKDPMGLQYVFQNVATALYAKMGGVPWTIDHGETADDELVIGLGSAELSGSRFETRQRHIGITTVFRGDGNYLLSNLSRECSYDEYPAVLRETTVQVLRDVKKRNGWQPGQLVRIVFHAFKPLRNIEVADIISSCVKEVGDLQRIEFAFLTVSLDHGFIPFDDAEKGVKKFNSNSNAKGVYVPKRGLVLQIGQYTRLLCTTGPKMLKRPDLPMPHPLLLHLHKQSTYRDFPYLADQVLKFTSLSWRSTLPTDRPVTILYSSWIAEQLGRLQKVEGWSPVLLNTKLRNSKWFL